MKMSTDLDVIEFKIFLPVSCVVRLVLPSPLLRSHRLIEEGNLQQTETMSSSLVPGPLIAYPSELCLIPLTLVSLV